MLRLIWFIVVAAMSLLGLIMIDIEKFKIGTAVWVVHNNRPVSFVSHRIEHLSTSNGGQINIAGATWSIPADQCYLTEMELIEAQINYWRDLRLLRIVQ